MTNNNKPRATTSEATEAAAPITANSSDTRSSLRKVFQQQLRNFQIEAQHAWQNKDMAKIWYYTVHVLGLISYTAICLLVAAIFGIIFTFSGITGRGRKKHGDDVINVTAKFLEDVMVGIYRAIAKLFEWPDINERIYRIPLIILNTIVSKLKPNRVTQFFGYGTLAFLAYLIFTNFGYIVYRMKTLFGGQPLYR